MVAAGLSALATLAGAQEPAPAGVFPARSEAVTVDVVVLDGRDRPVKGLSREDFVVREDGSPRVIDGFREVDVEAAAPPAAEAAPADAALASNEGALPDRGRIFVILFDDVHLTSL
jgi:hypothetical protein